MQIRLQKRIADSGLCSRRKAEELILAGRVKVNGETVTTLGTKVEESDKIEVNRKPLKESTNITVILNKPKGYVCTKSDPFGEPTVMELLPKDLQHLNPVGRLDKGTEGLLLLSSDGELVQRLTHPKFGHTKLYYVAVKGHPTEKNLERLASGDFVLDGYKLVPMRYSDVNYSDGQTAFELELQEGRKRQIRQVMEALGFPVIYLKRLAIGNLTLDDLPKGKYRILSEQDILRALE